ncbi:MAG: hypothetical protein J6C16_04865, partial [Clostridia bacterium]|nr:hypothetical protein [Clostridia bacterium]
MKKLLSVILTVCMLLSIMPSVIAEETQTSKLDVAQQVDVPLTGANSWVYAPHGTTVEGISDPTSDLYKKNGYDYIYDWKKELWWDKNNKLGVDNAETDTEGGMFSWTHSPVYYKVNGANSAEYINLDENNNWKLPYLDGENVKYLTYNIKPEEK